MSLPDTPNTLREKYYSVMAGQNDADILPNIETAPSTENRYLDYIARNGGGGGGSTVEVTQIKTSGEKIATITVDDVATDLFASAGGGGGGAVDTVNGKTGDVVLTATDVGALPDNTSIPSKTSDLTNDSNFAVDANYVHTDNNYTTAEKTKLSGIAAGAEVNVQPDWSQTDTDADDYIKNKPTLGTAAAKDSTNAVTANSTDLVESGAVATALTGEDIVKSATGTAITLTDSADARVQDLRIYGRTESGASVGDNGLTVTICGKNLLNYSKTTGTKNDVTYTINRNAQNQVLSIELSGTASADTWIELIYSLDKVPSGTILSGCPSGGGANTYYLGLMTQAGGLAYSDKGDSVNITNETIKRVAIFVHKDINTAGLIFYPMIRINGTSADYAPYTASTATITTALPLRSNGDVKDEIDFADGVAITRIDSNGDVLATPVITPLSATEITAFRALRTFDSVTNIMATDDPDMSVTYIKNTANGEAVGAIEDDLQGQITVLNTAKQPKTLDTPITIGGTSRTTVEAALGALNTAKEDAITQSATLTLTVAGWDSTLKTQTVTFAHDTTKRNVIDITVSELEDWAECGVLPTGETNAGISFKCEEIPESALTFKVTSMGVTT